MRESYIRIVCANYAQPKYNRLQLRTTPPSYIELQPGENILTIEEYPSLKYGFSQIKETVSDNCQEVEEIDLSHFDGSELVSMERMFFGMPVKKIIFGSMRTPNLRNAKMAFSYIGCSEYPLDELDLSTIDLSSLENAECMFQGANIKTLKMRNATLTHLKNGRRMIRSIPSLRTLIFDGLQTKVPEKIDIEILTPITISLKGCRNDVVKSIVETVESYRRRLGDGSNATYILDDNLSFELTNLPIGRVKCNISKAHNRLPIFGNIPTRYTSVVREAISWDPRIAKLMEEIRSPRREIEVQTFPPIKNNLDDLTFSKRPTEDPVTLQEFYQKASGSPLNAQLAIVLHNKKRDTYRIWNTEVIFRIDYNWEKSFLEFYSTDMSKGSLIEWSQLADAISEDTFGQVSMVRKYHQREMIVDSNTPIFLNSTYGLKKLTNVVTFIGYTRSLDEPRHYIGLVIEEGS